MEFDGIEKSFQKLENLSPDNRIKCDITYEQINSWNGPHYGGRAVTVSVDKTEVGNIEFAFDELTKKKSLEIDLTPYISGSTMYSTLLVEIIVDKDFLYKGTRTKAVFSLTVKGQRIFKQVFETEMPIYASANRWPIRKP